MDKIDLDELDSNMDWILDAEKRKEYRDALWPSGVQETNPYHEPSGSPIGGHFAHAPGGSQTDIEGSAAQFGIKGRNLGGSVWRVDQITDAKAFLGKRLAVMVDFDGKAYIGEYPKVNHADIANMLNESVDSYTHLYVHEPGSWDKDALVSGDTEYTPTNAQYGIDEENEYEAIDDIYNAARSLKELGLPRDTALWVLTKYGEKQYTTVGEAWIRTGSKRIAEGGEGSGNFAPNHRGIPDHQGGSLAYGVAGLSGIVGKLISKDSEDWNLVYEVGEVTDSVALFSKHEKISGLWDVFSGKVYLSTMERHTAIANKAGIIEDDCVHFYMLRGGPLDPVAGPETEGTIPRLPYIHIKLLETPALDDIERAREYVYMGMDKLRAIGFDKRSRVAFINGWGSVTFRTTLESAPAVFGGRTQEVSPTNPYKARSVLLIFSMTKEDITKMADGIFKTAREAYDAALTASIKEIGCDGQGRLTGGPELKALKERADWAAQRVANTYHRDLMRIIDAAEAQWNAQYGSPKGMTRAWLAVQVKEALDKRWEWKEPQIAITEKAFAVDNARLDFWNNNQISGEVRVRPVAAVCKICQGYVDRGWVSLQDAKREFTLPVHVNCPHILIMRPIGDTVPKCNELWRGGVMPKYAHEAVCSIINVLEGGEGSGHFGHKGIPDHQGGSLPNGWQIGDNGSYDVKIKVGSREFTVHIYQEIRGRTVYIYERGKPIINSLFPITKPLAEIDAKIRAMLEEAHIDSALTSFSGREDPLYDESEPGTDIDEFMKFAKLKGGAQAVMDAYTYKDEITGLETRIERVHHPEGDSSFLYISGTVLVDGQEVGHFDREISANGTVYHAEFEIDRLWQKGGFGSRFYQHSEDAYVKMGISTVRLLANKDVGGYAWARMGFDFMEPIALKSFSKPALYWWRKEVGESGPEPPKIEHAWDLAAMTTPNGVRVGKNALLGESWQAIKVLKPSDEGYTVGQIYYRAKGAK
jgi:hypothetical protein